MLDIYTKNRIYRINSTMSCIEVIDRKTGARAKDHPMLGARMGGGQRRSDHRVEVADPIPVPGLLLTTAFIQPTSSVPLPLDEHVSALAGRGAWLVRLEVVGGQLNLDLGQSPIF
jgi:hypothetical protein